MIIPMKVMECMSCRVVRHDEMMETRECPCCYTDNSRFIDVAIFVEPEREVDYENRIICK